MMRFLAILILLVLVVPWVDAQSDVKVVPEVLFKNLDFPDALAFAPDGRIFFNEKNTGNIRVIQKGVLQSSPFATLRISNNGEQGLLGIALDPSFARNGFVYVYYTYLDGSLYHGRITRFTAAGNTGTNPVHLFDVTDPTPQSTNHDGGYLKFGPDGKLYVQVGEFAVPSLSQDLSSNAGKILRMNPDGSAPTNNPFKGSLVYAYGIRNAFGMDFDPNTHMLIETEAGPSTDEINIITAGANYGWPMCTGVCSNPAYADPIITFNPATTPTGIAYGSPNTFYFGEWNTGELKRLELTPDAGVRSVDQVFALNTPAGGIVAVERGPDGNIYFSTTNAIYIYRLESRQTQTSTTLISPITVSTIGIIPTATTDSGHSFDSRQTFTLVAAVSVALTIAIGWKLYRKVSRQSSKSEQT